MSGLAFIPPRQTPVNSSGRPYASASLTFFRSGTTTPANVYATSSLTTAVGVNGVVTANSAGLFPAIYLDPNVAYRAILKNQAGVTLWDEDNIPSAFDPTYPLSAAESAAGISPVDFSHPPGDSRRYASLADWASLGGELWLVGDYSLGAALTFPSNTVVRGVGRPLVTVAAGTRAFQATSSTGFTVEGIRFNGSDSSTVYASSYDGFEAGSTALITVTDSSDVRIHDCEFSTVYNGISVLNCDRVWVTGNRVSNWYLYGIVASLCVDFTIEHNVLVGCDQAGATNAYGITATGDEAGSNIQSACSISFNVIRDVPSWDGIMTHDVSGLRIIGNDIRNVRNGIDVGHVIAGNKVRDIQICDNLIESTATNTWGATGALHSGIVVTGFDTSNRLDTAVISGNVVKGFFKTSGMVGAGSPSHISVVFANYVTVTGNAVRDGGSVLSNAGVYIAGNCEAPVITGNVLQGAMTAGGIRIASCTGSGATIADNTVIQTTASDPAVYVTGSTLTGAHILGNGGNSTVPFTSGTSTITYAQRSSGATSVADGGTVAHNLTTTPARVIVTPSTASEMVSVTARGATTFTVAIKKHDNSAGTTQTVYWQAEI